MTSSKTHRITTPKHARTLASLVATGALLAVPAVGLARNGHANHVHPVKPAASATGCAKAHSVAFGVGGTFVSAMADDAATPASEATVTLTVTSANRHARLSGDIADQDLTRPGIQVRGATYTVPAGDAFVFGFHGYQGTDTPSPGDKVRVGGKIALTKRHCAPAGTTVADRYGAVDVRRVSISDRDADA
ncbi:MAG: hypothetical protein QOJ35_1368 [Solirubrobacteraceae bacterium]|jgi:hypothetical protein|nr:hypothetical protein [Solirubrobacteraceae bacterium]